jgi:hypothetical protein
VLVRAVFGKEGGEARRKVTLVEDELAEKRTFARS